MLLKVFDILSKLGKGKNDDMELSKFKIKVNRVLDVWKDWGIFRSNLILGFTSIFNKSTLSEQNQLRSEAETTQNMVDDSSNSLKHCLMKEQEIEMTEHRKNLQNQNLENLEKLAADFGVFRNTDRPNLISNLACVYRGQAEQEIDKMLSMDNLSLQDKLDRNSIDQVYKALEEKDFPHGTIQRMLDKNEDINLFIEKFVAVTESLLKSHTSVIEAGDVGVELNDLDFKLLKL